MKLDDKINLKNIRGKNYVSVHVKIKREKNRNFDLLTSPVSVAECDSVYEDTDCHDGCVLASPGYPGLYPPNIRCRYLITSGPRISIAINFTAVLLPSK